MPYRIDLPQASVHAFDALIELGALDVEEAQGGLAAILPDSVTAATVANRLGLAGVDVSEAMGRDDDSVWMLSPRLVQAGTFMIVPAGRTAPAGALVLAESSAFGTGLHPTTVLCLEVIEELLSQSTFARLLDIGTGSGILALAALQRGVETAVGLDVDPAVVRAAEENARLNGVSDRFRGVCGSAGAVDGAWPLIVANIRAAELIEIAPLLVQRLASGGSLVLSGIQESMSAEVSRAYRRMGTTQLTVNERGGWVALLFRAAW